MPAMTEMPMPGDPLGIFMMWAAMMAVMMIPTALPPILRRGAWFAGGYLAVWTVFSAVAALLQWQCAQAGLLSPTSALQSTMLSGLVVAGVGLYQLTPIKRACLACCRADAALSIRGARRMKRRHAVAAGLRYGRACLGCCGAVMALMFVGGVTSIGWMAAIAAYVMLERLTQRGIALSRLAGITFIACGTVIGVHASF